MPYFTVSDGTPLWYKDEGKGPVLVLLQGLMLSADYFWQKNQSVLSKDMRVITVDLRSHGQSGKPLAGHTIAQCAQDLSELFQALDLKEITLGGLAFGAMVALDYIRQFGTDRLKSLLIIEAQVRLTNADDWPHATFGDFSEEAGAGFVAACHQSREPLGGFLQGAFATPPDPETMAAMEAQMWLTPTAAVIAYIEDMLAADYRADLATISLPTLLIYGRGNNATLPTELGRWIETQMPTSRFVAFKESGHSPFWEEADLFNQTVADFVTGGGQA